MTLEQFAPLYVLAILIAAALFFASFRLRKSERAAASVVDAIAVTAGGIVVAASGILVLMIGDSLWA